MVKVFSYTGKGTRETNEDYVKSEILSDSISLHIVADGMGGYQFGEVASQVATEAIFQFIVKNDIISNIKNSIQQAIEFANEQILLKQQQHHSKLGTTLAGVLIIDNTAYVFWLGDVQIQHFRDNKQLFISESHTLINEMKKNGSVSTKEIERYKHIVTKSLSGTPLDSYLPIIEIQLQQGDTICISTDGLYNSVNPSNLVSYSYNKLKENLQELNTFNTDNLSVIIIQPN